MHAHGGERLSPHRGSPFPSPICPSCILWHFSCSSVAPGYVEGGWHEGGQRKASESTGCAEQAWMPMCLVLRSPRVGNSSRSAPWWTAGTNIGGSSLREKLRSGNARVYLHSTPDMSHRRQRRTGIREEHLRPAWQPGDRGATDGLHVDGRRDGQRVQIRLSLVSHQRCVARGDTLRADAPACSCRAARCCAAPARRAGAAPAQLAQQVPNAG